MNPCAKIDVEIFCKIPQNRSTVEPFKILELLLFGLNKLAFVVLQQEKGKTRKQDKYIVYPPPNNEFTDTPISPPPPEPTSRRRDTSEDTGSSSPPPPRPLHFNLPVSQLNKATACVKDAKETSDPRVSKSERLLPIRERRISKKRPSKNIGPTGPPKQPAASAKLKVVTTRFLPRLLAKEDTLEGKGEPADASRAMIKSPGQEDGLQEEAGMQGWWWGWVGGGGGGGGLRGSECTQIYIDTHVPF